MKVYVNQDCLDSNRSYHAAGSTPEMDDKKEQKLFDLGLVEEYDEKKHGVAKEDAEAKVQALELENQELKKAVLDAEAKVQALEGFVESGKDTQKGHYPEGYKEYKGDK